MEREREIERWKERERERDGKRERERERASPLTASKEVEHMRELIRSDLEIHRGST